MSNVTKIIPIQFFGIGDVIFCITLVKRITESEGATIEWPVLPHFVDGLNRAYGHKGITFTDSTKYDQRIFDIKEDKIIDGVRYLPLRWTQELMKVPYSQCMSSKYDMYGMDYLDWKDEAMPKLDNVPMHGDYSNAKYQFNLVNKYFGSNSQFQANIQFDTAYPTISMDNKTGLSLFDWWWFIVYAKEVHFVSSSLLYFVELLNPTAELHIYPRIPLETDFKNVDYLFTKPYILH